MRVASLLILAAWLGAQDGDTFYKYPRGTAWTYAADFAGEQRIVVYKITEVEAERRHVDFDVFREGDPGATASENLIWFEKDGAVEWAIDRDDGEMTPRWRIWKIGSKPADTWDGPDKSKATYVGNEEVVVPAGSFKDAVHVHIKADAEFDFYFVAGTGMVKMVRDDGQKKDVIQLKEVKRGS